MTFSLPRIAPLAGVLMLGAQALLAAPAAEAATVTLNSAAMGRYDSSGAGFVPGFATDSRAFASRGQFLSNAPFFVFNLPAVLNEVTDVVLRLTVAPGGITLPPGEGVGALGVFAVSTPVSDLLTGRFAGSPVGQAIFGDLTSGGRLGGVGFNAQTTVIEQTLDFAAINALNAAADGSRFAIGLSPLLQPNGLFAQFTGASLVLTTNGVGADPTVVASPAGLALLGFAVLLLFGVTRRDSVLA
jgi:hypothetical protein